MGVGAGHDLRDKATAGRADQHGSTNADRIHEPHDVGGGVLCAVSLPGPVGVTVTALRRRVPVQGRREMPQHHLEVPPGFDLGVHEHDRGACRVARLGVGQAEPARKTRPPPVSVA